MTPTATSKLTRWGIGAGWPTSGGSSHCLALPLIFLQPQKGAGKAGQSPAAFPSGQPHPRSAFPPRSGPGPASQLPGAPHSGWLCPKWAPTTPVSLWPLPPVISTPIGPPILIRRRASRPTTHGPSPRLLTPDYHTLTCPIAHSPFPWPAPPPIDPSPQLGVGPLANHLQALPLASPVLMRP